MEWYNEAAEKFIEFLGDCAFHEIPAIKYLQETDIRFHFSAGMQIRNELRQLGYTDDIYGNLDDHYIEILEICYEKEGIKD